MPYSPTVSPRHWGREEENMLSRSGMMYYINQDPNSRLGYEIHQNPDGSGLILGGQPPGGLLGSFNLPNIQKIKDQGIDPKKYPGLLDVTPDMNPDMYQGALKHELGHAGQFVNNGYQADESKAGLEDEELRQRLADIATLPPGNPVRVMAERYVKERMNMPQPVTAIAQISGSASSGMTGRPMSSPVSRNPFTR